MFFIGMFLTSTLSLILSWVLINWQINFVKNKCKDRKKFKNRCSDDYDVKNDGSDNFNKND